MNYFKKKAIYKISIGKFNVYSKKEVIEAKEKEEKTKIKKNKSIQKIPKINLQFIHQPLKKKFSEIIENEQKFKEFQENESSLYIDENNIYIKDIDFIKDNINYQGNFYEIKEKLLSNFTIKTNILFNFTDIPRNMILKKQI